VVKNKFFQLFLKLILKKGGFLVLKKDLCIPVYKSSFALYKNKLALNSGKGEVFWFLTIKYKMTKKVKNVIGKIGPGISDIQ
jgi:hypothetical protein